MLFRGRDRIRVVSYSNRAHRPSSTPVASERTTPLWIAGWLDQRIPVVPCDEWEPQQVKAFRLIVNGSGTCDEALLSQLSLWSYRDLNESAFDLILTGFDPGEIDRLLAIPDEERATAASPLQTITLQREQSKISRTILSSDRTGFPCLVRPSRPHSYPGGNAVPIGSHTRAA